MVTSNSFLNLQNGSDIRGISVAGNNGNITLGEKESYIIGAAFATWLSKKSNIPCGDMVIAVGNDPRISAESLKKSFCDGVNSMGASTIDTGLSSTPAMYMVTIFDKSVTGSVMITASHLPADRNGFKFFASDGGLNKQDIRNILEIALETGDKDRVKPGNHHAKNLNQPYWDFLVGKIRKITGTREPLKGFRILVDAGNGSGGFYAEKVLNELGADTRGSLYLEPYGLFPNHIPNPEEPDAISDLCNAVREMGAHLGIIFDTDVDRAAIVDKRGNPVARNELIALISSILLEEHPGSWVVTDSITSNGLTSFIESNLGGHHHRFKRGYKNVINEAIRLNTRGKECHIAIETSGHAALRENYFLDDGAYLVTRILCKVAALGPEGDITSLISELSRPAESEEFRININQKDFPAYGAQVIKSLGEFAEEISGWTIAPNNYEGIRVMCDKNSGNGWFLLRLSLHDPVLPLNIESDEVGGVSKISTILTSFFKQFESLDCNPLYLKSKI